MKLFPLHNMYNCYEYVKELNNDLCAFMAYKLNGVTWENPWGVLDGKFASVFI